jgi:hypothetical protein
MIAGGCQRIDVQAGGAGVGRREQRPLESSRIHVQQLGRAWRSPAIDSQQAKTQEDPRSCAIPKEASLYEATLAGMAPIDPLWTRIVAYSGEVFRQQRGKPFTYSVSGNTVYLDTSDQSLSRRDIAVAFSRMPLTRPEEISDLVGPRYIFAILTDWRITGR